MWLRFIFKDISMGEKKKRTNHYQKRKNYISLFMTPNVSCFLFTQCSSARVIKAINVQYK